MNTTDLVAGLREYVEAKEEWLSLGTSKVEEQSAEELRYGKALDWMVSHASAIADELAMLAEEVKHLKPLAEEIVAENARLRAEVERMRQAASSVLSKSYEASAYVGGLTKSRAYWDEYDEMMAPLWIALADAKGGA